MAYNALNNLIDAYIYANGVQAITGQILNGVLKQMVSQLGSGYHLMGVAGPETVPASNDYAMAYFAATAGEYADFGGITLAAGEVAVLLTSGNGSWSKQTIYNVPTGTADLENTANFITNAVTDLANYYTKDEIDTTLANYPTLEALATALADYYTKTEIDGQKAETDAALGDRYTKDETDTKLGDYYKKTETYDKDEVDSIIAALSRQEYIVAWDGLAAPDVSAIPAGVTVTYNATPYTGTLAASASTVNKIYMVWNGVAYDMYGTSQDGGYSWVPMGTTTVDLSQYATKAELSQLQQQVTADISQLGQKVDEFAQGKFYGYFGDASELPAGDVPGFAYVGTAAPFAVYNYNGTEWVDSGVTIDRIPAGNGEDIDYNAEGLLQFADRAYDAQDPNGMGYVILRKNKTFAEQVTQENTIYEIRYAFDLGGDELTLPSGSVLKFNGGHLDNGTITGASSTIDAGNSVEVFGRSCFLLGTWTNDVFLVDWWSCYADGVDDDYSVLRGISSTINENGGGKLVFPKNKDYKFALTYSDQVQGNYVADYIFNITVDCDIDLNGCTFSCSPNGFLKYRFFIFRDCVFSLKNGKFIGDKMLHDYTATNWQGQSSSHEWCWGIYIAGAKGVIENMDISMMPGDAVYINNNETYNPDTTISESDVEIRNCSLHDCRRQGVSYCGGEAFKMHDCLVYNIGTFDGISGTAPMYGLDLEYESVSHFGGDVFVCDNVFKDCDGGSIGHVASRNRYSSLVIRNCKGENAHPRLHNTDADGTYTIQDLEFWGSGKSSANIQLFPKVKNISFDYPKLYIYADDDIPEWDGVTIVSQVSDSFYVTAKNGASFKNCKFKDFYGPGGTEQVPGFPYNGGFQFWEAAAGSRKDVSISFENCNIENVLLQIWQKDDASGTPVSFKNCDVIDVAFSVMDTRPISFDKCNIIRPTSRAYLTQSSFVFITDSVLIDKRVPNFSLASGSLYLNGKTGFMVTRKIVKNSIVDIRNWVQNGYYGNAFLHAYNSQVRLDSLGSAKLAASKVAFENCYVVTNCSDSQVTKANSTRVDLKSVFWQAASSFTISEANVSGMTNKEYKTRIAGNYAVSAAEGEFVFLAWPTDWGTPVCEEHPLEKVGVQKIADEFGFTSMDVYKTTEAGLGSVTLTITEG